MLTTPLILSKACLAQICQAADTCPASALTKPAQQNSSTLEWETDQGDAKILVRLELNCPQKLNITALE